MRTAVILGAGFSQAAGFPRTRDLFESTDLPRAQSPAASENYLKVRQAYGGWKAEHPDSHAEHWLAHLYELRENPLQEIAHGTTWDQAVRYALAQLVHLPPEGTHTTTTASATQIAIRCTVDSGSGSETSTMHDLLSP